MRKTGISRLSIVGFVAKRTPHSLYKAIKYLGLNHLINKLLTKGDGEMIFQSIWADKFKNDKKKTLKYWNKYLYLKNFKKACNFSDETKVLDVGCGVSTVLHYVRGKKFGIDPLAQEYSKLYSYPKNLDIRKGVGERIPFKDKYFDVVFCSNVLDHTDKPVKVISEINRVLKNDGHVFLSVHIFSTEFKRDNTHPHTFTKERILSMVKKYFTVTFQASNQDVGIYNYVVGEKRKGKNDVLVLFLRKAINANKV